MTYLTKTRFLWCGVATAFVSSLVLVWPDKVTQYQASTEQSLTEYQQMESTIHNIKSAITPIKAPEVKKVDESQMLVAFSLVTTSVSEDPKHSSATLLNQNSGLAESVRQGGMLQSHPGIKVVSIIAGKVQLTNGDSWWMLEVESLAPLRNKLGPDDLFKIIGAQSGINKEEQIQALISANIGQRTHDNILSEATFASYSEDGEQIGLYLTTVQPSGFYGRLGLAAGDILLEVNGMQLNTPDTINNVIGIFMEESSFDLTVNQSGTLQRIQIDMAPGA